MKKTLQIIIRFIIGLIFCYFIYHETGIFTSVFVFILLTYTEVNTLYTKTNSREIKRLKEFTGLNQLK